MSVTVKAAVGNFFDKKKVLIAVGKARAKALGEAGRAVRKAALRSLTYAVGPSSPGQPPHAHKSRQKTRTSKSTGRTRTRSVSFLREFLFYSFDDSSQSVVIGPARLNSTVDSKALPALEYGGTSTIVDHGKRVVVAIRERPFMRPALKAEQPNFAGMWRNSVR